MKNKYVFPIFKNKIKGKAIKHYLNVLIWQTRDIANYAMLFTREVNTCGLP